MNEAAEPQRVQYLDVLRVLSMLSVVFLHTAAGNLRTDYGSPTWHFANVATSLLGTAVPLFFMISGALLLDSPKTLSLGYTLKKRLPRVLVPFLLWSLVGVVYYLLLSWQADGAPDMTAAVNKLKNFPAKPTAVHLWFMYVLIPLYILSPLIKHMTDALPRRLVVYLLAIWAFFTGLLPILAALLPESYRPILVLNGSFDFIFMAGFVGFFIAGYYLMKLERHVSTGLLTLVIVLDTVVISLGTWWKTDSAGVYSEMFKTYSRIFVLILAVAVFLLVKELMRERRLKGIALAVVRFLAPLTFGIYLAHAFVVDLLSRLLNWLPANSIWILCLAYVAALAVSVFCVFLVSAIKPLCYVLTGQQYRSWRKR